MTDHNEIIEQTQNWLTRFIIHHNICPFAKREYDKGSISYDVISDKKLEEQLHALIL